jgi:hypothetical protein
VPGRAHAVDGQIYYVYDGLLGYEPVWGVEADVEYRDRRRGPRRMRMPSAPGTSSGSWRRARWRSARSRGGASSYGESYFTAVGDHVEAFGTAVACEPAVCAQLTTIEPTARRLIDLEYTGDPAIPLRAVGVRPAP